MATSAGFRQQCPSCEAMVPVKDASFIGKKIDCPKCKYRFVVEEPPVDEDDVEEVSDRGGRSERVTSRRPGNGKGTALATKKKGKGRRDDDDEEAPRKKKGGPSTTLLVGIGLGVVAVIV